MLAVFARSCYLDLDGAIAAIVAEELLNGPLNIVIRSDSDPPFDRLTPGGAVTASADAIRIAGWPPVSIQSALRWDPRIVPWSEGDMPTVTANLSVVTDRVRAEAPAESFVRPTPSTQSKLALLWAALEGRSSEDVRAAAQRLAGLGSGLTPSGDDVLVGVLIALAAIPDVDRDAQMREAISVAVAGRTTRISEAYLQAAGRGEASEAWQRLLAALRGESVEAVAAAGRRVMAFGETSGADMLAGFVLAAGALIPP